MLNAVDQVIGVLPFESLIDGQCLETGESQQVSVSHSLADDAVAIEKFSPNLANLVVIEDYG